MNTKVFGCTLLLGFLMFLSKVGFSAAKADATSQVAYEAPGQHEVEVAKHDWVDGKRDRKVPAKIYYPKNGSGPFPVILFSHGLGGTRDGYEYLGRHWASHGYLSIHLQHLGSDDAVWNDKEAQDRMQAMRRAAANPQNSLNRPLDVSFAIDQLAKMNRENSPLKGRLDLERIGAAGHSYGAYTTLAVAGEVFVGPLVDGTTFVDPRVKAAIPMSSPVPRDKSQLDKAFGGIKVPCLHMTGTKDASLINDTKPAERRMPYDHMDKADQYLITFEDGDHMIFSGRGRLGGGEKDVRFQQLIRMSTTAFWDAYLRGDPKAKTWLVDGGCGHALGQSATFEKKLKDSARKQQTMQFPVNR